jgi:uncharacterized integral membrane protein
MKWVKLGFLALAALVTGWGVFLNQDFLFSAYEVTYKMPFGLTEQWTSSKLPVIYYLLIFFILGALCSYFLSLKARFRNRRSERTLKARIAGLEREIQELKHAAATPLPASTGPAWTGESPEVAAVSQTADTEPAPEPSEGK